MKKELFIVDVNFYKEITSLSYPFIQRYADKIGAKFTLITDRKFPDMHPSYEMMQIYDLGRDNDWNICMDADFLLQIGMYDVTQLVPESGYVGCWEQYSPKNLYNNRGIVVGMSSNFIVAPKSSIEIFKPLGSDEDYRKYCEYRAAVEYCLSYNRQRMGYKLTGIELPGARDRAFKHLNITTGQAGLEKAVKEAREFLYPYG